MRNTNKKGFTIVELVVVVAVIAILAAVLIPTFSGVIKKANESKDIQLVRNLNTALATDTEKNVTPSDAYAAAAEYGFDVAKINAKASGNAILWDSVNDIFCYLNDGEIEYVNDGKKNNAGDVDFWVVAAEPSDKYSTYLYGYTGDGSETISTGLDVGDCILSAVTYESDADQDVVIRTTRQCTVTIDAPNSNVDFYGFANTMAVTEVKGASLHIYGSVNELSVAKGHVAVESTGIVSNVVALAADASITNNGYIVEVADGVEIDGKEVGGDYEIATLAQLETFRDAVNDGNTFKGVIVKLTANITLNDGWTPIGEGARKIPAEGSDHTAYQGKFLGNAFRGTFNGNSKTISNLNNKGYAPAPGKITEGQYVYGFFGIVASDAVLKDITFTNVDIDTTRYADADGECVGALVGLAAGKLEVSNVKVSGSIKGYDAVGGVIGAVRDQDSAEGTRSVTINNCENNASVTATFGKAAGVIGYVGVNNANDAYLCTINNNKNNGRIQSFGANGSVAGILLYDGRAFNGSSVANGNVNTGNLYIPEVALSSNGTTHGFGFLGASVTGKIPNACTGITGNTNSGKLYAVSGNENEEISGIVLFAQNCIAKTGSDYTALVEANK
ncbi:MAG: prepilin-type N-terminal cleavage/methylation domain-containing protein [Ruminococcaceae bacterium]|nr:prepilin-type N-terminal cleavage/methylation domain-containing protein [Oscillospiraceae bacterium]